MTDWSNAANWRNSSSWRGSTDLSTPTTAELAFPAFNFELFMDDPFALSSASLWRDTGDRVVSFTTHRGRSEPLGDYEPGTCTIVLDNSDGQFDPESAGSMSGLLTPNRRARLTATYNRTTYYIFDGYVDSWPVRQPYHDYLEVTIPITDAFKILGRTTVSDVSWLAEKSGQRMFWMLAILGWPTDRIDIDGGNTAIEDTTTTDVNLAYMQRVARSEMGDFFVSEDGKVTFWGRHTWTKDFRRYHSAGSFGDTGAALENPVAAIEVSAYDADRIKNVVIRANESGATATAQDATSKENYGICEDSMTDLVVEHTNELADQAAYVLAKFKDPIIKITNLQLNYEHDTANLLPHMLGRKIGDRITVNRGTPKDTTTTRSGEYWIESIDHVVDVGNRTFTTSWGLAPADAWQVYFTIENATLGKLDTGGVLCW